MLLLTILILTLILLIALTVIVISVAGTVGVVIFGDVIVCIVFIVLLIQYLIKRKYRK